MSLRLITMAARIIRPENSARRVPATPDAALRSARLTRKTRMLALAAHIGQAGAKSRIGLPKWSA